MKRWTLPVCLLFAAVPALAQTPVPSAPPSGYDECDSKFIAYLGAEAYQFSPAHAGELGTVRLFTVLSHQRAAAFRDLGRAFWRLEIRDEAGGLERSARGEVRIDEAGQAVADFVWDGRDEQGRLVPPGRYLYTFRGRFLADRIRSIAAPSRYEDLESAAAVVDEAFASTDAVIVDYGLDEPTAARIRQSLAASACEVQQNTPIEASFGYNFYYGSTHSHSNWSDGGQPTTGCSSGNAYGSGTYNPAAVYDFARNSAGLDYWVINEHNHLINDAMATNSPPVTEAKVRQRYADGRAAANAATVNGVFIGIYGMEWGVTTNADQGHVTLLETPKLFGWETCSTCNGPNAECTPGTNCYFDVFTPKRFGYLTMYKRSVENPSVAGALGILCHPSAGEFDNYAFNADADAALQGIAVRSGLAFNTAATCADANMASTDYSPRWRDALNRGFHLGPVADHDAHCNNYGAGIPNRTVYLLPNGTATPLTKTALLQAHKARHFFASEDSNAQLVFATADGAHVMGDIWSAAGTASLRVAVYDPANEGVSTIEVWRGQIGGGVPASAFRTASNQSTLSFTESLTSGTYYYYVHAVQADGHDLWSAPMWITYGPGGGGGTSVNVGGWRLSQLNSKSNYTIPTGTSIPANGYLIVGRNATKSAFEAFWRGGSPLPSNVLYLNSADTMPVINGSETYDLYNAAGTKIDGRTVAMGTSAGSTFQRKDPCLAANLSTSWTTATASSATPGTGAAAGCAKGVVINEFADALGTGNFIYEFIELHNDQ
ncbi:MAG TPA: hypothetical protein VKM72_06450 [Thermoanaerobaculia bacterium]|nr:hypothetical protein [Thermoanaerobaculia bacterium]